MPTREVLTPSQRDDFLALPEDIPQIQIERYYSFTAEQIALIHQKRRPHNRLGFAVQWAYLRYPGRPWEPDEIPPEAVLSFIAQQIGVATTELAHYAQDRDNTRLAHLGQLIDVEHYQSFDASLQREMTLWLQSIALSTDSGVKLMESLVGELRARRIVLPALSTLERLAWEARRAAQLQIAHSLSERLTDPHRAGLDALLRPDPERSPHKSALTWVRQVSGRAAPTTILRILDRLGYLQQIGLPQDLRHSLHQNRLLLLAREGARYTPQFLSRVTAERRYSILAAFVVETIASYTDQVILLHERLIQQMMRKGEISHQEKFTRSGRSINDKVRLLVKVGRALIAARQKKLDPFAAIESVISWQAFEASVTEAEGLSRPPDFDALDNVEEHYRPIRRYAPQMLQTLEFQGTAPTKSLLMGLEILRRLYADEFRKIPPSAPTDFVKERWRPYVLTPQGIDRRYYELCVLTLLRDGLRSGDIFVVGSRQFQDFEEHLLTSQAALAAAHTLAVEEDAQGYLARREQELHEALTEANERIAASQMEGVRFQKRLDRSGKERERLIVSPLVSTVPPEAEEQARRAYEALPTRKITELLVEVDRWTNFTQHFTALRQGTPPKDKEALFAAILAEATNLGPVKMAAATPGVSYGRIAQVSDWHIRDETYAKALAQIVHVQHQQRFAALWGEGTTSSSDAQRFPVGGRRESRAQVNARYGSGPSVMFYTHLSDRYAPFHTKVITAGVRDATHVLDGLLYHESDLAIQEHYTDTAGYTEHVFALCHLLGFRFAPRIRDLTEKKLFTGQTPQNYPALSGLLGEQIRPRLILDNWQEVRRLAISIHQGSVTASLMLSKLAAYPRQNNLAVALREIGRIERTLFTLEWLQNPELRRRVTVGLNKGEARHALARAIFFYRRGMVQERNFEEMQNRANGLNLVVAAITLWNTVYLEKTVEEMALRRTPIPQEYLPHISPLAWDHILLTGEYHWNLSNRTF